MKAIADLGVAVLLFSGVILFVIGLEVEHRNSRGPRDRK